MVSDFAKNKYGMPRSYCLVLVASILFISQVATGSIDDITHLWIASALLGTAYGAAFALVPTVCIEWFGMRKCFLSPHFLSNIEMLYFFCLLAHFSENLGYLFLSPIVAGNLFSLLFGRNLDAHRTSSPPSLNEHAHPNVYTTTAPQCLLGLNCYRSTIYLTMFATFLTILLSVWAGYRDWVKIEKERKMGVERRDLVWRDEEVG